jgi:hypothetical protein
MRESAGHCSDNIFELLAPFVRIPGDVDQRSELMSITIPK